MNLIELTEKFPSELEAVQHAEFVFKYNNRKEDDMFETLVRNSMTRIT
jgi:hypothetical protein